MKMVMGIMNSQNRNSKGPVILLLLEVVLWVVVVALLLLVVLFAEGRYQLAPWNSHLPISDLPLKYHWLYRLNEVPVQSILTETFAAQSLKVLEGTYAK
jgi:hypothetical protein